jgi:hypothetical protein
MIGGLGAFPSDWPLQSGNSWMHGMPPIAESFNLKFGDF